MNQNFIFLILSIIFTLSYSFDFTNYDYNNILVNPYRVFGLPPWSSMKDIKKRYRHLIKQYHPDKTHKKTVEQFELIQTAYEQIKKERKEKNENDEEKEISFFTLIKATIKEILFIEILFTVAYYASYWTYNLQKFLMKPILYMICSYVIVDNYIPHFFNDRITQLLVSCLIGLGIFILIQFSGDSKEKDKQE
jgi:hypothetical protein